MSGETPNTATETVALPISTKLLAKKLSKCNVRHEEVTAVPRETDQLKSAPALVNDSPEPSTCGSEHFSGRLGEPSLPLGFA